MIFFLYNEMNCFAFILPLKHVSITYFVIIIIREAYQLEKETRQITNTCLCLILYRTLMLLVFFLIQIVNDPIVLPKNLNPRLKNLIEGLLSKGKRLSTFCHIARLYILLEFDLVTSRDKVQIASGTVIKYPLVLL